MRRAEAVGQRPGLRQVAAGDRRQHAVFGFDDGRQELLAPDLGRRQNTPAEHASLLPECEENLAVMTLKEKRAAAVAR